MSHFIRMNLWLQILLIGGCFCVLLLVFNLHLDSLNGRINTGDNGTIILKKYPSPSLDCRPMPSEKFVFENSAKFLSSLPMEAWDKVKNSHPNMYYKNSSCARYPVIYDLNFENINWQSLKTSNGTFHLYGAYYDERPVLKNPVVRILGMINRIEPTIKTYCQIWMRSKNEPIIVMSEKYRYVWYKSWGNFIQDTVQPYLITCPMPDGYHDEAPTSVSLVENMCDNATNHLRVVFEKPPEKKKFAVCVKGLDFLYTDISVKLAEWIELLHLLGADKVFLYTLHVHANVTKVLNYYENLGKINVTPLTLPGDLPNSPAFQHLYLYKKMATKRQNELIPYNDCFYKNMYTYDYIALLDVDEVIFPVNGSTWDDLMETVKPLSLVNRSSTAASYNIRNAYFYDDVQQFYGLNNDIPPYMHMLQHVYRAKNLSEPGRAVKCFHNTEKVLILHNHYPLGCATPDCYSYPVDPELALLHHYRGNCSVFSHQNCEQIRNESIFTNNILKYTDELLKNTMTALDEMGFFHKN